MIREGSLRSGAMRSLAITCLILIFPCLLGVAVASEVQLGCGSRRLTQPGIVTRLYCVSTLSTRGGDYLLLRNPPGLAGDDVTDREAAATIEAMRPWVRPHFAGACYQRRGIDPAPICRNLPQSQGLPIGSRPDDRRPYPLFAGVGLALGLVLRYLVSVMRRQRKTSW